MAKKNANQRQQTPSARGDFHLARAGLALGALALFASTAYMNVSGWVLQADTLAQGVTNGLMASGFELMALTGLAWAGFQYATGRKGAAVVAGAIAVTAIVFNTFAAQNFLHLQADELANAIEMSGQNLDVFNSEIEGLDRQIESIIEENGGTIPRPVDAINAQYSHFDPDKNPINMGRRDAEIALREEYERLQAQILELKRSSAGAAVTANDSARTVIPAAMLGPFVWALEVIKGTVFFALGTANGNSKRSKPLTDAEKRKWAIIRAKERQQQTPKIA